MKYPLILAFEMSSYEDDAFPIAAAWSLDDGQIKSTLISPDSQWLDQLYESDDLLDFEPDTLLHEGHSPKAVIEELLMDLEDAPLYSSDPYLAVQALEKLHDSLDRECSLFPRPVAELLTTLADDERELCRQECLELLDLNLHHAADQVRLWLEMLRYQQ